MELADVRWARARSAGVAERLLGQALAVVEGAGDRDRGDVAAEGRELRFLHRAHLTVRIQHDHARPRHAVERLGHRAAGVPGRGHQHRQRRLAVAMEMRHQAREHARADVLEGEGRPVEQLDHRQPLVQADDRHRKIEGIGQQAASGRPPGSRRRPAAPASRCRCRPSSPHARRSRPRGRALAAPVAHRGRRRAPGRRTAPRGTTPRARHRAC